MENRLFNLRIIFDNDLIISHLLFVSSDKEWPVAGDGTAKNLINTLG